jgi:hypothetical protein
MSYIVDLQYTTEFLKAHEPNLTETQAKNAAADLIFKLTQISDLTFICRDCRRIRGVCRCDKYGQEIRNEWSYRAFAGPWICSVPSLLELPDAIIETLGPKSRARVRALIEYLQQQ